MKRKPLVEIVVLAVAAWILFSHENPSSILLGVHRAAYLSCQRSAAVLGRIGMELEKSYRIKVAP
jgi:hypothetical protein